MRRIAIVLLAAGAVAFGVTQAVAAPTCTTSAKANGAWGDANTWTAGVPAAGVDACIPAGLTVAIGSSTMAGPGTTTVMDGGTLQVKDGYPTLSDGRVVDIEPTGRLELVTDNRYVSRSGTTPPLIRNRGTIVRTVAGANDVDLRVPVENDGTVVSNAGRLVLSNGGADSAGAYGGGAGTVELGGGTHQLADGADLLGGVELTAGELTVASGTAASSGTNAIKGGTLGGPGGLSVDAGTLTWAGGTMRGPGTTTVKAAATLSNPGYTTLADGRAVENQGTLELPTDNRYVSRSGTTPPVIHNTGTIRRTAVGANDVDLRVPVDNDGTVTSDGGRLVLSNGGAGSSGTYGGGAGTVELGGGTHQLADGAGLAGGVELTAGELTVASGSAASTGANLISGGTLGGPGGFSVDAGTLTWAGGTMRGPGTTTVKPVAKLANTGYTTLADGRALLNQGTFELPTDNRYVSRTGTTPPVIRNTGTIRRTAAGASGVDLRVPVENDGTVVSDGGVLQLTNGGSGGSSGTFGGGAGQVRLSSGAWQLDPGARLQDGTTLASTTVTVADGATATAAGAVAMTSGVVTGAGTLAIGPAATFSWSGGTMAGSGTTAVAPGGTLALTGTGSVSLGGTRTVDVGGIADFTGDSGMGTSGAGATPLLRIAPGGALRKSGGTLWSYVFVPVRNEGTADGEAGKLVLMQGAAEPHTGLFTGKSATEHVVLGGDGHVLTSAARLEDFAEIAGDVAVRDGDTLTIADRAQQTGGELSGDVAVTGRLTWSGGSHELPGATTVAAAGRIVVEPEAGDTCASASLGEGRRLDVAGLLQLLAGSDLHTFGDRRPEIHNAGRIELDSGGGACGDFAGIVGDGLVANAPGATIEKLGGAGGSQVSTLDNDGTLLNSTAGPLHVDSTGAIGHAGTFRTTGTGVIAFDFGDFVFDPGATLAGDVELAGADLRVPEGVTLDVAAGRTLTHAAGSISGAGDLQIAGTLKWTGGYQEGPGATLVEPGASVTVTPADGDDQAFTAIAASRSLVNRGAMTVDDAYLQIRDGASILNLGTLELRGASELEGYSYGSGFDAVLHNTGVLRKTGADAIDARVPVDNDGTVDVQAGSLELYELVNWSGIGYLGERGIVGGEYLVRGTLVVPDALSANASRLVLDGADSKVVHRTGMGAQADALPTLGRNAAGGELVLRGGRDLTIADDRGPFVNQGVLDLGAGSVLTAKGFRQAAGAVLRPAVTAGGAGAVDSTGPAVLAGRLDTPASATVAGDTTILSATAISGAFTVTGGYSVVPSATAIKLRIPAVAGRVSAPAAVAPPVVAEPAEPAGGLAATRRIPVSALDPIGPWARRGAYLVAARRGATLRVPAVAGRALAIVARTGRRAGAVRVSWAGRSRTVSLRSAKPGRRTIRVFSRRRALSGTVRLTATSARRVAVRALLVRR